MILAAVVLLVLFPVLWKNKKLWAATIVITATVIAISFIFDYKGIASGILLSLTFGLALQAFVLTSPGNKLVKISDQILQYVNI